MTAWAKSLFLLRPRHSWVYLEVWWDLCVFSVQRKTLPKKHSFLKWDGVIPIPQPWNLLVRMCAPTVTHGACHWEFSPEAALCRFLFELQRKEAANKHKYTFISVVIIILPIIMELKGFPLHFCTEIGWLKSIKDLWKQSAALAAPEQQDCSCIFGGSMGGVSMVYPSNIIGVPLHSSDGDGHQGVVLDREGKTRYVVGADRMRKWVHVRGLLGEMMEIIPGS